MTTMREVQDQQMLRNLAGWLAAHAEQDEAGTVGMLELSERWSQHLGLCAPMDPRVLRRYLRELGYTRTQRVRPDYPASLRQVTVINGLRWKDAP